MNTRALSLGRILGIPLQLDPSWFLIFGLLTWTLGAVQFPASFPDHTATWCWGMGALTALLLFVSVVLHELGHAVVAQRYNVPVRRITLFLFGGVAEIENEPPSAAAEFFIALAGPLASLLVAVACYLFQPALAGDTPLLAISRYLITINTALAVFNLLPGYPLDGGRVLRAAIWAGTGNLDRATRIAAWSGRGCGVLLIVIGILRVFQGDVFGGIWIALLGMFLHHSATVHTRTLTLEHLLSDHTVAEAMRHDWIAVPGSLSLQHLVEQQVLHHGRSSFLVREHSQWVGVLNLRDLRRVPRDAWAHTSVAATMRPLSNLPGVREGETLWRALQQMNVEHVSQLPILDQRRDIVGLLRREDVVGYLQTVRQLTT